MINYTWTIATLEFATEENGLNKVVKTVHWIYKGTDETSGISYKLFGVQAMDKPYDELTEAIIISWLEKKLDVVSFQELIATEIEKIKNPPVVVDYNPFAPKLTETLIVE